MSSVIDPPGGKPGPAWFERVFLILHAQQEHGTTAHRPTTRLYVGRRYYDETLSLPIWIASLNPAVWKDAAGNVV